MRKLMEIAVCVVALLAFAAAMSDGEYFPWANLAGITVLAVIVYAVERVKEPVPWARHHKLSGLAVPARIRTARRSGSRTA